MIEGHHLTKDEMVIWWRILNEKGWGVLALADGIWRHRLELGAALYLQRGATRRIRRRRRSRSASAWSARSIYTFGNEAQKKRYLPRHRQCRRLVVPGLFRAGSGSDLASLKTRAERKGDKYIINGQKTWTTLAQHADMIFNLCRTDPAAKKQSGIPSSWST